MLNGSLIMCLRVYVMHAVDYAVACSTLWAPDHHNQGKQQEKTNTHTVTGTVTLSLCITM